MFRSASIERCHVWYILKPKGGKTADQIFGEKHCRFEHVQGCQKSANPCGSCTLLRGNITPDPRGVCPKFLHQSSVAYPGSLKNTQVGGIPSAGGFCGEFSGKFDLENFRPQQEGGGVSLATLLDESSHGL